MKIRLLATACMLLGCSSKVTDRTGSGSSPITTEPAGSGSAAVTTAPAPGSDAANAPPMPELQAPDGPHDPGDWHAQMAEQPTLFDVVVAKITAIDGDTQEGPKVRMTIERVLRGDAKRDRSQALWFTGVENAAHPELRMPPPVGSRWILAGTFVNGRFTTRMEITIPFSEGALAEAIAVVGGKRLPRHDEKGFNPGFSQHDDGSCWRRPQFDCPRPAKPGGALPACKPPAEVRVECPAPTTTTTCEVQLSLAPTRTDKGYELAAQATNKSAWPVTLDVKTSSCPAPGVRFSGLPATYDPFGTCRMGECQDRVRVQHVKLAAGATERLATGRVPETCNKAPIPPAHYDVTFTVPELTTTVRVCPASPVGIDIKP